MFDFNNFPNLLLFSSSNLLLEFFNLKIKKDLIKIKFFFMNVNHMVLRVHGCFPR